MHIQLQFILAALLLGAASHVAALEPLCKRVDSPECRVEREANCKKAIAEYVELVRTIPLEKARDKAENEVFKARLEKLITDNRRKGVEDCTTWGQMMGLAARQ